MTFLKDNADVFAYSHSIRCGFVLRNHEGYFVTTDSVSIPGAFSPKEAEALSIREALS